MHSASESARCSVIRDDVASFDQKRAPKAPEMKDVGRRGISDSFDGKRAPKPSEMEGV